MKIEEIKEAINKLEIVRRDLESAWRGRAGLEEELIAFDSILNLVKTSFLWR